MYRIGRNVHPRNVLVMFRPRPNIHRDIASLQQSDIYRSFPGFCTVSSPDWWVGYLLQEPNIHQLLLSGIPTTIGNISVYYLFCCCIRLCTADIVMSSWKGLQHELEGDHWGKRGDGGGEERVQFNANQGQEWTSFAPQCKKGISK
jgi:hypothetical protein